MESKLITGYTNYKRENHPDFKGVQIIDGKNNFSISWLNQQAYCEYQLYLEHFKGIEKPQNEAMKQGSEVHNKLEEDFKKEATPATFDEVVEISKESATISREVFVISPEHGIRGFIDEIIMTPSEIIIIDDKPGKRAYSSQINQIRAYCLAIKSTLKDDKRTIRGALRTRGTDNIFYSENFTNQEEENIKFVLNRMDSLFKGEKPFIPTKNPNKCRSCRYKNECEVKP